MWVGVSNRAVPPPDGCEPHIIQSAGDVLPPLRDIALYCDNGPGNLSGLEVRATFDSNALTFQKATYGSIFNMANVGVRTSETNGIIQAWVQADNAADRSDKNGVFVTLEFKVNDAFDGSIDASKFNFTYAAYSIGSGSYDGNNVLVTPAVHAHHYGEPSKTAGDCKNPAANVYQCTAEGCPDAKLSVPVGDTGDHAWGELIPAIAPTANKDGVVAHRKCTVCGACCDANGKLLSSIVDTNRPESDNTVVTVVIIVVAVVVVVVGAVVALRVLKKKKIL